MDNLFDHIDNMMRNIFSSAFNDSFFSDQFIDDFNDFNSFAMSPFPSVIQPQNPRDEMLAEPNKYKEIPNLKRDVDLDALPNPEINRKPNLFSNIFKTYPFDNEFNSTENFQKYSYGKSRSVQIIKRSDGSSEEIVVERSSDGKETKSVTKKIGDEVRRYVTKSDLKSGETESIEEVINFDNDLLAKNPPCNLQDKPSVNIKPNSNGGWLSKLFDYWK